MSNTEIDSIEGLEEQYYSLVSDLDKLFISSFEDIPVPQEILIRSMETADLDPVDFIYTRDGWWGARMSNMPVGYTGKLQVNELLKDYAEWFDDKYQKFASEKELEASQPREEGEMIQVLYETLRQGELSDEEMARLEDLKQRQSQRPTLLVDSLYDYVKIPENKSRILKALIGDISTALTQV
jgi:hypothetical protein